MSRRISIVIPTLNESRGIASFLGLLQIFRQRGHEIIVADGGSADETAALAMPLADRVMHTQPGRAAQMNAGAVAASGDVLFFLHADSQLPERAGDIILHALINSDRCWGRFDIRLFGPRRMFRVIEWFMNTRSKLTGVSSGDQGLFVERTLFESIGGYPAIALMEDIAICVHLKKISPPICLRDPIVTSSRRWEKHGVWRTIWLMWRLRFAYWRGVDPAALARIYYPQSTRG